MKIKFMNLIIVGKQKKTLNLDPKIYVTTRFELLIV